MVEVSLTVGKLDASLALLLTKDHHLIEFPTILLPDGVNAGSVVTIKCEQDIDQENKEKGYFEKVQEEIFEKFGKNEPKSPILKIKNVTQTSAVLEWEPLDLGSADIKSLTLYKNGSRLGQIPNPLVNTTTKLSGLPIDTPYEFYLRLDTTAGVYESAPVNFKTHKMTDLSGITVCLGQIDPKEGITREDIEQSLANMGAKPLQDEVKVDTTHFICTLSLGPQWTKALENNIPIVRPEWLKASETERRIIGVRNYYLDADPAILEQHRFNKPKEEPKKEAPKEEAPKEEPKEESSKEEAPKEEVTQPEAQPEEIKKSVTKDGLDEVPINSSEPQPKDQAVELSEPEPVKGLEGPVSTEEKVETSDPEDLESQHQDLGETNSEPIEPATTESVESPEEEAPAKETPVEEAPAEETPVEEAPAEETPVEEAPAEETPAEETPVEEAPVENTLVQDASIEPVEDASNPEEIEEPVPAEEVKPETEAPETNGDNTEENGEAEAEHEEEGEETENGKAETKDEPSIINTQKKKNKNKKKKGKK